MVEVLVEYDYIAKEPNELTLTKGDIIKDVVRKQEGWCEGILNDKKGLFPDNFVKMLDNSVTLRNKKDPNKIRQCRVVYNYKPEHNDELNLKVGDIVDILGEEEEGWWRGILNGKEGVFPSNFVEEILTKLKIHGSKEHLTNQDNLIPSQSSKLYCEAKYSYDAQNEDELTLRPGDLVTLISKESLDTGWWKGELNGIIGVFPDNFVTLISSDDNRLKTQKSSNVNSINNNSNNNNNKITQRKSLESITNNDVIEDKNKTIPPVPTKKPSVPIKKSPTTITTTTTTTIPTPASLFSGLKKKIVDVVDGASGSKNLLLSSKNDVNHCETSDNIFDDVVRRPLLSDVRATRPKAPGRRPPSAIYKENESGIMNGNADHAIIEKLNESSLPLNNNNNNNNNNHHHHHHHPPPPEMVDGAGDYGGSDGDQIKPKLREWEKHKAPWLAEMKMNQAKRSSTSPGPEIKLKLTTTPEKQNDNDNDNDNKSIINNSPNAEVNKTNPLSNSINNNSNNNNNNHRVKTPPNDLEKTPVLRNKKNVASLSSKPHTIQNNINIIESKSMNKSPSPINKTPPSPLPPAISSTSSSSSSIQQKSSSINESQYQELLNKINNLEEIIKNQTKIYRAAIEDIEGKLQVETDMRIALQAKFEEKFEKSQ